MVVTPNTTDLDAAYAAQNWPLVETLAETYFKYTGFHHSVGEKYIDAMVKLDRPQDALSWIKYYYELDPAPSRAACLAHLYAEIGFFESARRIFRPHYQFVNPTSGSFNVYSARVRRRIAVKEFDLTWQTRDYTSGTFWMPLPHNSFNQQRLSYSFTGGQVLASVADTWGNEFVQVRIPSGKLLTMKSRVRLTPASLAETLGNVPANPVVGGGFEVFLGVTPGIDHTTTTVSNIVAGFSTMTYRDKINAIMDWANENLTYMPPGSPGGLDNSEDALLRGGGNCEAISGSLVALLRACGVPARMIRGHSALFHDSGVLQQHTIVQFYYPGIGWVDWDHWMNRWELRSDFVRLGTYNALPDGNHDSIRFWQDREYIPTGGTYLNGPYNYTLFREVW